MSLPFDLARHGVLFDHRVVGGIDLATIEVETNTARGAPAIVSWMIGVDDDGIRLVHPFGKAPFRDGVGAETDASIADWISTTPLPASDVLKQAMRDVLLIPSLGAQVTLVDAAITTSMALKGVPPIDTRERITSLLAPIRARLGETRFAIHYANGGKVESFFMPRPQVEGYEAFVEAKPWYRAAASSHPYVEFQGPAGVVEGRLLREMGLPAALASRLGEATHCVHSLRLTLAAVPLDWIPDRDDVVGWAALKVIDEVVASLQVAKDFHPTLLAPVKGRWADYVRKLARSHQLGGDAMLRLSSKDGQMRNGHRSPLAPLARDFHDVAVRWNDFLMDVEGMAAFEVPQVMERALIGDRGLGAVMELSRRWHADPAFEAGSEIPYREWPAIIPSWRDERTGIDVIPLTNSVELAHEGAKGNDPDGIRGLGHCVGGEAYVAGCAGGGTRIVSLRRDGARLSTAQIDLEPTGPPLLNQHRGRGNAIPPREAEETLERYLALPMTMSVRSDPARSHKPTPPARVAAGLAERLEAWRPYLAGDFRHATIETLGSIAGVDDAPPGFAP